MAIIDGVEVMHKETFFERSYNGIPAHFVVQYYIKGSAFPEARYFNANDDEGVLIFEKELGLYDE